RYVENFGPGPAAQAVQPRFAIRSVDVLHDVVQNVILDAGPVKADDVGMIQAAENIRFALKALAGDGILCKLCGKHLQRAPLLGRVRGMSQVHLSHCAGAEFAIDYPASQLFADHAASDSNMVLSAYRIVARLP